MQELINQVSQLEQQVEHFKNRCIELETQLLRHTGLYVGTSVTTGEVLFEITPTEAYNKKWAGNIVHCLKGRLKSAYGCTWQKVINT